MEIVRFEENHASLTFPKLPFPITFKKRKSLGFALENKNIILIY